MSPEGNSNQQNVEDIFQKQKAELVKKNALMRFMTKEARERLNNLRLVRPDVAESVELALLQALQMGQIREIINESQLKLILSQAVQKKDYKLKMFKK